MCLKLSSWCLSSACTLKISLKILARDSCVISSAFYCDSFQKGHTWLFSAAAFKVKLIISSTFDSFFILLLTICNCVLLPTGFFFNAFVFFNKIACVLQNRNANEIIHIASVTYYKIFPKGASCHENVSICLVVPAHQPGTNNEICNLNL